MRRLVLGAALAACMGTAYAGDPERTDLHRYDATDYSARVFYRLDFGGTAASQQQVGLRFDNAFAESRGAPAAFQVSYDGSGSASVKLHGVELHGAALAAGQEEGGLFGSLSMMQLVGIGMTVVVAGIVISEGVKGNNNGTAAPAGSGSGGV